MSPHEIDHDLLAPALSISSQAGYTVATISSDLDIACAPVLGEQLLGVLGPHASRIIIDLSRVTFCDASGLAALVGVDRRARLLDSVLRLAAPAPPVAAVLRLTGLGLYFQIFATLPAAIRAPAHPGIRWPARRGGFPQVSCSAWRVSSGETSLGRSRAAAVIGATEMPAQRACFATGRPDQASVTGFVSERFTRPDRRVYSLLCLALAVMSALSAWSGMQAGYLRRAPRTSLSAADGAFGVAGLPRSGGGRRTRGRRVLPAHHAAGHHGRRSSPQPCRPGRTTGGRSGAY
jgi:anti-anti-sigma factor